jgi:hypothetical protein
MDAKDAAHGAFRSSVFRRGFKRKTLADSTARVFLFPVKGI